MARHFVFPDPNDRSPNEPSVIVSTAQILGLFNQENPTDKMERVTQKVQDWFIEMAKDTYQWDAAQFAGNQCLLNVVMTPKKTPTS